MAKTQTKIIEAHPLSALLKEVEKTLAEGPDATKGSDWRVVQIVENDFERKWHAILERDAKG